MVDKEREREFETETDRNPERIIIFVGKREAKWHGGSAGGV